MSHLQLLRFGDQRENQFFFWINLRRDDLNFLKIVFFMILYQHYIEIYS
jgi:hypothetical protein